MLGEAIISVIYQPAFLAEISALCMRDSMDARTAIQKVMEKHNAYLFHSEWASLPVLFSKTDTLADALVLYRDRYTEEIEDSRRLAKSYGIKIGFWFNYFRKLKPKDGPKGKHVYFNFTAILSDDPQSVEYFANGGANEFIAYANDNFMIEFYSNLIDTHDFAEFEEKDLKVIGGKENDLFLYDPEKEEKLRTISISTTYMGV